MYYSTDTPEVVKDMCRNSPNFIIAVCINLYIIGTARPPLPSHGHIQVFREIRCRPGSQLDAADFRLMVVEPFQGHRKGVIDFTSAQGKVRRVHIGGKGPDSHADRRFQVVQRPPEVDVVGTDTQFFPRFPQGCRQGAGVGLVDAAAGKADFAGLPVEFTAADFKDQMFFPIFVNDRHQDGAGNGIEAGVLTDNAFGPRRKRLHVNLLSAYITLQ